MLLPNCAGRKQAHPAFYNKRTIPCVAFEAARFFAQFWRVCAPLVGFMRKFGSFCLHTFGRASCVDPFGYFPPVGMTRHGCDLAHRFRIGLHLGGAVSPPVALAFRFRWGCTDRAPLCPCRPQGGIGVHRERVAPPNNFRMPGTCLPAPRRAASPCAKALIFCGVSSPAQNKKIFFKICLTISFYRNRIQIGILLR